MDDKIDRRAIQDLAKAHNRPIGSLLALSDDNDPFYVRAAHLRDAEWFAALYEHGFGQGVPLRRVHYRLVSQEELVLMPCPGAFKQLRGSASALRSDL